MAKKQTTNESPNAKLTDLLSLDYRKLEGNAFVKYHEIADGLFLRDKYDYEVWKAQAIEKKRFNEDTGKVDAYIAGIKLLAAEPIMRTRVKAGDAIEMNKQVSANPFDSGNSKYYLLAKPVQEREMPNA